MDLHYYALNLVARSVRLNLEATDRHLSSRRGRSDRGFVSPAALIPVSETSENLDGILP